MTWQPEIEELKRRQAMAEAMGGPDKVKRQHDGGRLTVRERVLKLVDKDSFHEVGAIAGRGEYDAKGDLESLTPSNCVMGRAEIDGRPVVVLGDDFTVRGGSEGFFFRVHRIIHRAGLALNLPTAQVAFVQLLPKPRHHRGAGHKHCGGFRHHRIMRRRQSRRAKPCHRSKPERHHRHQA